MVIYSHIRTINDIRKINQKIRNDVRKAKSRARLTELYNRSKYLVTLTFSPNWRRLFRGKLLNARKVAREEFTKTANLINKKLDGKYDITYG